MWKSRNVGVYMVGLGIFNKFSVVRMESRLDENEWWERDKVIRLGLDCENILILCLVFEI